MIMRCDYYTEFGKELKERVKAREVFLAKKNVQPRFFRYLCVINRT